MNKPSDDRDLVTRLQAGYYSAVADLDRHAGTSSSPSAT